MARDVSLEKNPRWKGGRATDSDGYILLKMTDHPFANNKGYVREHRIEVERSLNRFLQPHEVVHHINHLKDDNRIENLQLLSGVGEHTVLERLGNKYPRANGIWFTCQRCEKEFYKSAYWVKKPPKWCSWRCRYPRAIMSP